jgi:polar amino acid transport system substrate-binding protein
MKLKYLAALMVASLVFLPCTAQIFAQEKKVTLATLEWEPYIGSKMPRYGLTAEIVVEAFKRTGYTVDIKFYPWTEAMKLGRAGKVDGIFPAYHSKSREEHFVFSKPFAESPLGFYKKSSAVAGPNISQLKRSEKDIVFPEDPRINQASVLEKMKQYRFGVVAGYVNTPAFDAATFLTKVEAKSDEENLMNLVNGQVDLIFIDRYVAKNIIVQKFPWHLADYEFMEPALANKPLFVGFSKKVANYEQKLRDFNHGLEIAREDGVLKRLISKYGLKSRF